MALRRLYPEPGEVAVEDAVSGLRLGERAPDGRPYVVDNMVSTADGRATIDGRAGPVGDGARPHPLPTAAHPGRLRPHRRGNVAGRALRASGARPRAARGARGRGTRARAAGLRPDPHAGRALGHLAVDRPRLARGRCTRPPRDNPPPCPANVTLHRMAEAELTIDRVLRSLRADHNVRSVLCEGGPTINRQLLEAEGPGRALPVGRAQARGRRRRADDRGPRRRWSRPGRLELLSGPRGQRRALSSATG